MLAVADMETEKRVLVTSLLYVGNKYACKVMERVGTITNMVSRDEYYENIRICEKSMIDNRDESDLNIIVIDAEQVEIDSVEFLHSLVADTVSLVFAVGPFNSDDIKNKLVNSTRCFCFKDAKGVEKYITSIILQLFGALSGHSLISADIADIQTMISHANNLAWYGRGFGPGKGKILAKQLSESKMLNRIAKRDTANFLVCISGDICLDDCCTAMEPIYANLNDEGSVLLSIRYEEEPYDEISVLIMVSY